MNMNNLSPMQPKGKNLFDRVVSILENATTEVAFCMPQVWLSKEKPCDPVGGTTNGYG